MFGYHIPKNKTFKKSVQEPHIRSGINAFQIFVRNPKQLQLVEYKEKEANECLQYVRDNNLFLVSHGTYLLNCATKDKWDFKIESVMNELIYAEKIGAIGSVFHTGKHLKFPIEECINNMYEFISIIIQKLQDLNSSSIFILETCASCGTELLSDLIDFGAFYNSFTEIQKKNFKICIDTCHIFSAGYSLKTIQETQNVIDIVDNNIGWNNVAVIHLNDSKKDCGCCVDRHENLCCGFITKEIDEGLKYFVKHCYSLKIPLILETPYEDNKMYETYDKDLNKIKEWIYS